VQRRLGPDPVVKPNLVKPNRRVGPPSRRSTQSGDSGYYNHPTSSGTNHDPDHAFRPDCADPDAESGDSGHYNHPTSGGTDHDPDHAFRPDCADPDAGTP
jgi:hypothetical protein